jgi:hypothetical protein
VRASKAKRKLSRRAELAGLKQITERDLEDATDRLLSVPMEERTNFLLVPHRMPDGSIGWAL